MIGWRFYLEAAFNSLGAWVLTYLIFSTVLFGVLAAIARWRPLAPSVENLAWRVVLVAALLLTSARIAAAHVGIDIPVGPDMLVVSGTTGRVILAGVALSGVVVALLTARLWRLARGEYRSLRDRTPFEDSGTATTLAELAIAVNRRAPRLTCSATLRAPVAIGRDEICLPADFTRLFGGDGRRAILAHELGHLVRHDPTWRTAAQVLQRLLFFQPLQRLATRRLRETSEFVADDFAIRLTGRGEALVEALLTLTDRECRQPMQFAAAFSPRSLLLRRMRLALGEATPPPARSPSPSCSASSPCSSPRCGLLRPSCPPTTADSSSSGPRSSAPEPSAALKPPRRPVDAAFYLVRRRIGGRLSHIAPLGRLVRIGRGSRGTKCGHRRGRNRPATGFLQMDASSPAGSSRSSCRRMLVLLSLLTLVSCGGDSPTGPTPAPNPDPVPQEPEGLSGQVAYAVFDVGDGSWSLARQPLGGGDPILLELERGDEDGLPDRAVFQVRWSPDGSSLLYQSTKTHTDDWYLVLVDRDGRDRRLLTPHNGFAIDPEFSPDGGRILYKRGGLTPLGLGIPTQTSIVDLNGVSVDVVLEEGGLVEGRPVYFDQYESEDHLYDAQWGGDDAHLLVVGFFDASPLVSAPRVDQVEVFRVSLVTGRAVQRVTRNAVDETRFHASPDGTRLIVGRSTAAGREAVLLGAGGAEDRVLASNFDFLPRFASDGRHVSYSRPDGIWLLDVDAAEPPTRLSEGSGGTPARTWPDLYLER